MQNNQANIIFDFTLILRTKEKGGLWNTAVLIQVCLLLETFFKVSWTSRKVTLVGLDY